MNSQNESDAMVAADPSEPFCLTAFERYLVMDERDGYAMTFPVIWRIVGEVDEGLFDQAFREALSWHPLLHGRVCGRRWTWDDAIVEGVRFAAHDEIATSHQELDCRRGPMVRCTVFGSGDDREIQFVFHHVATDGVSAAEFCGDVFALYAAKMGKLAVDVRRPQSGGLENRATLDRSVAEPVSAWVAAKFLVRETLVFLLRRAESVRVDQKLRNVDLSWRLAERVIDRETSQRVIRAANRDDGTLNDWALVALLRTVAKWNDRTGKNPGRGWLVANVPVHMRHRSARKTSATNSIGYSFLARKRANLKDYRTALQSVSSETKMIQKWKMAGTFLDGVRMSFRIPGAMWLGTSRLLRPATCVLSTVGDPTRRFRTRLPRNSAGYPVAGSFAIVGSYGAAPTRPGTELTAVVSSIGGEISITIRLTPRLFSAAACERLAGIWEEEILRDI